MMPPNLTCSLADDYLRDRQRKSMLCLPLIKQQQLTGILLLENALTTHAFTPARIAVLELLAGQAAISLENTRLYSDLREREAKVRRLVDSNIIGICIFDLDGRIMEANDAFLDIVGYSRDDTHLGPPTLDRPDHSRMGRSCRTCLGGACFDGNLQAFRDGVFSERRQPRARTCRRGEPSANSGTRASHLSST